MKKLSNTDRRNHLVQSAVNIKGVEAMNFDAADAE